MILGLGGLAAGRAVGILLTPGRADRLMMGFLAAELIGTALALAAFRRARQVLVENQFERRRLD